MKRWEDALQLAEEFVTFLERDIFFDKPFINTVDALVVTNPKIGWEYANGQKYDQLFPEWEDISMGEDSFPDDFKYFDSIYYGLQKNNYFDIEQKNFSGINELWDNNIADMMIGDMIYIYLIAMPTIIFRLYGMIYSLRI